MPKDPITAINQQRAAFDRQEAEIRTRAAQALAQSFPEFVANATEEQLSQAITTASGPIRQAIRSPVSDPSRALGFGEAMIPGRGARGALSAGLDLLPASLRPETTAQAAGLGPVEDLLSGQSVQLDEAGQLGQLVATVGAAAVPLSRPGHMLTRLGQSTLAAGGAAGVTGGLNQVLENAQSLLNAGQANTRRQAFVESLGSTPTSDILARGLGEAVLETTLGAGTAFAPTAAKASFARMAGLSDEAADRMVALASRHGINLAVQDVTNVRALERARDTLGRVPLFNKPFKQRSRIQAQEIQDAVNDSLFSIAPSIREISEATGSERSSRIIQQNVNALNRLEKGFTTFKTEADRLYTTFRQIAKEEGAQVGNANTMFRAVAARKRIRKLPKEKGETPLPEGISARIDKELTRLIDMEPLPDLEAFIRRGAEIEQVIADLPPGANEARGILIDMKRAMEDDMHTNLVAPQQVIAALDEADAYYRDGMQLFSGQAARRIKRIDRSFGRVKLSPIEPGANLPDPGTASPNKVIRTMLETDDVGVINNLYEMLIRGDRREGQQAFREMVGTHFERVVQQSQNLEVRGADFNITNTKELRKALGLANKSSEKYIANRRMFELAGVNLDEFGEVLDLADRFFKDGVPDVSSFVSRRAVLGGLGSAIRAFNPLQVTSASRNAPATAADTVSNLASASAAWLLLRGASRNITNPTALSAYRTLLDPKRNSRQRMQAFKRLLVIDSGFLVFDQATGDAVSSAQNTIALSPNELARVSSQVKRDLGSGGLPGVATGLSRDFGVSR